jgi:hypothetical protein
VTIKNNQMTVQLETGKRILVVDDESDVCYVLKTKHVLIIIIVLLIRHVVDLEKSDSSTSESYSRSSGYIVVFSCIVLIKLITYRLCYKIQWLIIYKLVLITTHQCDFICTSFALFSGLA